MRLRITFYDAGNIEVETFETDSNDKDDFNRAMTRVTRFIGIHGTDPDEDGADAMAGTITFDPLR